MKKRRNRLALSLATAAGLVYVWWSYSDTGVCYDMNMVEVQCARMNILATILAFMWLTVISLRTLKTIFVPELATIINPGTVTNNTNQTNRRQSR